MARSEAGIEIKRGRGRQPKKGPPRQENLEFLRSLQEHHVVPLWDLQLAGIATDGTKQAVAKKLYGAVLSERESLYDKIDHALTLQREAPDWVQFLLESGGV